MEKNTKERILGEALKLFSQNGYLGTSTSDIAKQLDITKGALYRHYASKQEILDSIVDRMKQMDFERAKEYGVPEGTVEEMAEAYHEASVEKIMTYTKEQFRYWTEEEFASCFRKMLTLEQYRNKEMAKLYRDYVAEGPLRYMEDIFETMPGEETEAIQTALDFYGPIFLLYSVYDGTDDKEPVLRMLNHHIEQFEKKIKQKSRTERKNV